jgi:predicted lipid-binding transport protein (Tim44 family)
MRIPHGPGGFGMLGGIFADVLAGLVFILCFIIVIGLLFVLVRFLLVATKAAEIYVAKNGPAQPVTPAAPASAASTTSRTTTPEAKASTATRTRTPKTPPTT